MNIFEVPEDIGVKKIKSFYNELHDTLNNIDEDIILDLRNVRTIDLSFIQVLITAGRFMKKKGKTMKLQSVSHTVRDQLKLAGLTGF